MKTRAWKCERTQVVQPARYAIRHNLTPDSTIRQRVVAGFKASCMPRGHARQPSNIGSGQASAADQLDRYAH